MHKLKTHFLVTTVLLLLALFSTVRSVKAYGACDADFNHDGLVNILDYSYFVGKFFTSDSTADIDKNGTVNILDYTILVNFFFQPCQVVPSTSPAPSPSIQPSPTGQTSGIWIGPTELAALPTTTPAWNNVVTWAAKSSALPNFEASDTNFQNDNTNVIYMAKALVAARTGNTTYRDQVVTGIQAIVNSNPNNYNFRALGLGRELGAYVIAADLINLKTLNPTLDQQWRQKLQFLKTVPVPGGPDTLIICSNDRPNNWGNHCTATRLAIALYLNDQADVAQTVKVYKGFLGDRAAYANFTYGELSWQCHPEAPVGINPKNDCLIQGHNIGGAQPEERRRSQVNFAWPPSVSTTYDWEGLQGSYATAVMLARNGYPDVWQWSDQALLRAVMWNYSGTSGYSTYGFPFDPQSLMNLPASGDDSWIPYLVNKYYGSHLPTVLSSPGKNVGFTDWTHSL